MRFPLALLAVLCCALALFAGSAQAAGYKCKDKAGNVTFTDQPCESMQQSGKKFTERGAGYSSLTEAEKADFFRGFIPACRTDIMTKLRMDANQAEALCQCMGGELVNTTKYEQLKEVATRHVMPAALQDA
ncbi:protein of unknown function [Andreprevotia lacus DSM 23236]|jgi:hypothetical protein|uniref:DUF4124 domain-containing protein n=1 Tax=Andreprevotia lacus DSM 23236 TaxID=1121001 RepID=A0A1W1XA80_9NEIS|nr:DUF4124 domain-containing protein [Andreprevotia lacus]SMC20905.1 protein of unknown function [Andreprevotia lacus DSM 23236]